MTSTRLLLAFIIITTVVPANAQNIPDGSAQQKDALKESVFVSTDKPEDIYQEWWLTLKNGTIIIADKQNIAYRNGQIEIKGSIRQMSVPTNEVTGISSIQPKQSFRNTLIGTMFLSSMALFSPVNTPGYYIGSSKNSSNQTDFPGLSVYSFVLAGGTALAMAYLNADNSSRALSTMLDGTENEAAWRLLLSESFPRWHLHGIASYVAASAMDDWQAEHRRYDIIERLPNPNQYYNSEYRPDMTNINLGRLLRLGYSVSRRLEVGVAYQSDGIPKFYEQFTFARSGNPPQPVTYNLSTRGHLNSLFITGQYSILPPSARQLSVAVGGGIGSSELKIITRGFSFSGDEVTVLSDSRISCIMFGSCEYVFDSGLSAGLTVDYTVAGKATIPVQKIIDYDNRIYLVTDPFDLNVNSLGIGLSLGFHF